MLIAINIQWDTDNETVDLPSEILIPEEIADKDKISEYLISFTGVRAKGFDVRDTIVPPVLKLGQKIYLEPLGNAARSSNNKLKETTIKKVGRQYYYASFYGWDDIKINKTDLTVQDKRSNSGYQGYMTKTEYGLKQEQDLLDRQIRRYFDNWTNKLPLDDLRRIKKIILESDPSYTKYFE